MDSISEADGATAAQRVLRLPELLALIMSLMVRSDGTAHRAALSAAMRVNHVWAATALPLLWWRTGT